MKKITIALLLVFAAPLFADKKIKEDFKEIGHGFKNAAKGTGHAAKDIWKKTMKFFKDGDEKGEKVSSRKK